MLRDLLLQECIKVGRLHVATLIKKMAIVRPNQVWATDITYIPMAKGFV